MDERRLTMYSLAKRSNLSWNTVKNLFAKKTQPTVCLLYTSRLLGEFHFSGRGHDNIVAVAQSFGEGTPSGGDGFFTGHIAHGLTSSCQFEKRMRE